MKVIRLEDCTPDEKRLLLALVANRKAAEKRTTGATTTPAALEVDRHALDQPRRRAA